MQYKRFFTFLAFAVLCANALSQEAITVSGGDASSSTGSVSFSVGQILYTTSTGTTGTVSHGVQLPYEIFDVTGIDDIPGISLTVSAYPNPTSNFLTLQVESIEGLNLHYQILNVNGMVVETSKISENQTRLVFENRSLGLYFLRVFDEKKIVKTFKIIKN